MAGFVGGVGVLLVFGALAFWVRGVVRVQVPRGLAPMRSALVAGGGLCATALLLGTGVALGIACALGLALVLVFLGLDRIAPLPRTQPNVAVGSPAPGFTASDSEGGLFTLESLAGRPVLLKFFRGHW